MELRQAHNLQNRIVTGDRYQFQKEVSNENYTLGGDFQ